MEAVEPVPETESPGVLPKTVWFLIARGPLVTPVAPPEYPVLAGMVEPALPALVKPISRLCGIVSVASPAEYGRAGGAEKLFAFSDEPAVEPLYRLVASTDAVLGPIG